jgi:hypothetical protein
MKAAFAAILMFACPAMAVANEFEPFFHSTDVLAARDEYGLLHQGTVLNSTDTAPRFHWRPIYYFFSDCELMQHPAYVGAVQRDLHRLGYYCGEIDGIFSPQLADAIARYQKNSSMHVTGTVTVAVRRALHLP